MSTVGTITDAGSNPRRKQEASVATMAALIHGMTFLPSLI
jgi:hypothetical protein